LIELYDHLRCDTTKPIGAVECVSTTLLDKENKTPLAERAESCMRKAGTTVPLRLWVKNRARSHDPIVSVQSQQAELIWFAA